MLNLLKMDVDAMKPGEEPPSMSHVPDFAAIKAHPQAKSIAKGWQDQSLATQSLAPGYASTPSELFDMDGRCGSMCAREAGAWLKKSYGSAVMVDGKSGKSSCRVFEFEGHAILAFSEGAIGTGWQVLLGDAGEHGGGRSYGRAGLLACDDRARGYWPRFCLAMSAQMELGPMEAKAVREAASLDASLPRAPGAPRRPGI